ncbi:hypothetical protein EDF66_10396 [Sphingobacterium sp. JUb20]|nr:hypothetical protein [Sphingobacterium sp. JUb21]TCR08549.1 hypothetical protein EDF66_10396 [Sphingobacterium sp. JUb20]
MKRKSFYKILSPAILMIFSSAAVYSQSERDIKIDLSDLRLYSIEYDTYAQSKPTKYPEKLKKA